MAITGDEVKGILIRALREFEPINANEVLENTLMVCAVHYRRRKKDDSEP